VELHMVPAAIADRVLASVGARDNILVSGAASTGKTTLLNALVRELPRDDRLIIIEDTAEIFIDVDPAHSESSASCCPRNVVRFEARRAQDRGAQQVRAVTIRDLLRASLRHRPDRIVVGEVRGAEAADLLEALNTGHAGSISTIHASSARLAVQRLASCALQAGEHQSHAAICAQIADCVDVLIHLDRERSIRRVREVVRLQGYDFRRASWRLEPIYEAEGGAHGG
jgi:pilus assembly protein CpaF